MSKRKIIVIDTSVLLYDKNSIHSFPGNDVVLPMTVLDELDRFKEKPGLLGESARYINRFLDALRSEGHLDKGVMIEDVDQSIRVLTKEYSDVDGLDPERNDNKIISSAVHLQEKNPDIHVRIVTKDINLRVKCDALGIRAEDYYKDSLDLQEFFSSLDGLKGT